MCIISSASIKPNFQGNLQNKIQMNVAFIAHTPLVEGETDGVNSKYKPETKISTS